MYVSFKWCPFDKPHWSSIGCIIINYLSHLNTPGLNLRPVWCVCGWGGGRGGMVGVVWNRTAANCIPIEYVVCFPDRKQSTMDLCALTSHASRLRVYVQYLTSPLSRTEFPCLGKSGRDVTLTTHFYTVGLRTGESMYISSPCVLSWVIWACLSTCCRVMIEGGPKHVEFLRYLDLRRVR
jgi:hypothetical protein